MNLEFNQRRFVLASTNVWYQEGYEVDDRGQCVDIDECQNGQAECLPDTECRNSVGSYDCVRACPSGLTLKFVSNTAC